MLSTLAPDFRYPPNEKNCWIIAKPDRKEGLKEVLKETRINITLEGKKNLGAAIGSREYLHGYVSEVSDWVKEVA